MPNPPNSSALFLMSTPNDLSPVPAWPGADGPVQHGITPAQIVACQTGAHRPSHAKPYSPAIWELCGITLEGT